MARMGSFQGPTTPFGIPTSSVHPRDNDITPDPAKAEAEALKAQELSLYEDLQNLENDYTGKTQASVYKGTYQTQQALLSGGSSILSGGAVRPTGTTGTLLARK
jgi:hypothetical protein